MYEYTETFELPFLFQNYLYQDKQIAHYIYFVSFNQNETPTADSFKYMKLNKLT